jgi:hypothetical protein
MQGQGLEWGAIGRSGDRRLRGFCAAKWSTRSTRILTGWMAMPEGVEKRVMRRERGGVFGSRGGRDAGWSIGAFGLSEAIRS